MGERIGNLTPYQRFSLLVAGTVVVGTVILALAIGTFIQSWVAEETALQTAREVDGHYDNILGDSVFRRPFTSPEESARFDRTARFHLDVYEVTNTVMYRADGAIVYSYVPGLVGQSAFAGPDAEKARRAAAGTMAYEVTSGSIARPVMPPGTPEARAKTTPQAADEHAGHDPGVVKPSEATAGSGTIMRVWIPVQRGGELLGVAYVERNFNRLLEGVREMQIAVAALVALGSVILFLSLRRIFADSTEKLRAREAAERSARVQVAAVEELARLKDEFVSQVTHELRGPLSPILGYAELLALHDTTADQVKRYAASIQEGAVRLDRLVEDLLDLSRLESGHYRLERTALALTDLLERRVRELRHVSTRHEIVFRPEPDLPPVDADPDRVGQVVGNLVTNAIRYSPGGGEIELNVRRDDGFAVIQVRDHGIGIPAGRLERIFEKFYRVDNQVTRSVGGTGLGLAICRELIEAHGGKIWAESIEGAGTTVTFTLPLAAARTSGAPSAPPEPAGVR